MTHITYRGPSDARELDAADLKLAGVENFRKTTFLRDVPHEVSSEVAVAILERPTTYGKFEEGVALSAEREVALIESERKVELNPNPGETQTLEQTEDSGTSAATEDSGSSARKTPKKTT